MTLRYQDSTVEQRRRWRKTWMDNCKEKNLCHVCGNEKERGRKGKLKCRGCQKKQDENKKLNPQIRPNARKLIQSIREVVCADCQPKLREVESFWYNRR